MKGAEGVMNSVTVSFGSNFGDRTGNVARALKWFESIVCDCRISSIYETPEIHGIGKPYMNAVAVGTTMHDLESLTRLSKTYEIENGRSMSRRRNGEVPIDIDIVVCNSEILRPLDFSRSFFQIGFREVSSNYVANVR